MVRDLRPYRTAPCGDMVGPVPTEPTERSGMVLSDRELIDYVERLARDFAAQGMALIAGRILGWLLVSDPPEQSAARIGEAIGASKASVSTNLRMLQTGGLVTKITKPGDRTAYYGVSAIAWYEAVRRRIGMFTAFGDLLGEGVGLLGADDPRARRLADMRDFYMEVENGMQALWERLDGRFRQP